jgi:hypothetical protein
MDEYNKMEQEPNVFAEPSIEHGFGIPLLKSNILKLVSETKDEKLLKLVWNVLQDNVADTKPLQLSKHIHSIFEQYPKTMEKLAQ